MAVSLNIAGHLSSLHNSVVLDTFRPIHLRYLSFNPLDNNFKLLLDKGSLKNPSSQEIEAISKTLMQYFLIGLTLPNDTFWVNLRPDSPDRIIDDRLAQTDIGRIMLETDLQLKKDTANFTSPSTPEGREYWDRLYKKAAELYGSENITIPTLTRPWIVPGEIIIRETSDSAYIYKATLKVMLEQDYLKTTPNALTSSTDYSFKDERSKALNEYSTQLIRELIIPKLTKEVNSSKRYASLRQVYYSLIMAQWFKARFKGKQGPYYHRIDSQNLTDLTSKEDWSKTTYFNAYKKSFTEGEYNIQEPHYTPTGQVIRSYFSGGEILIQGDFPLYLGATFESQSGSPIQVIPASSSIQDSDIKRKPLIAIKVMPTVTSEDSRLTKASNLAASPVSQVAGNQREALAFIEENSIRESPYLKYIDINGRRIYTGDAEKLVIEGAVSLQKDDEGNPRLRFVDQETEVKHILVRWYHGTGYKAVKAMIFKSGGKFNGPVYSPGSMHATLSTDRRLSENFMKDAKGRGLGEGIMLEFDFSHEPEATKRYIFNTIYAPTKRMNEDYRGYLTTGEIPLTWLSAANKKEILSRLLQKEWYFRINVPWFSDMKLDKIVNALGLTRQVAEDIIRGLKMQGSSPMQGTTNSTFESTTPSVATSPTLAEAEATSRVKRADEEDIDSSLGGIDFRFLPIVTQAMTNLSANISSSAISRLSSINLDDEWQNIERLASSGIRPSTERVKEYIQASSALDKINEDKDKIIGCISDILRQEEDVCCETDPVLKDILVVLESIQQPQELKQVFLGKTT